MNRAWKTPDGRPLVEGVVAVPEKRNYLRHLAPVSGEEAWATRGVKALCGWVGLAMGCAAGADSHRDRYGLRVRRRHCRRCAAKVVADGFVDVDAIEPPGGRA
jgi:hypothetical protein